jgi:transcriptional regulator with PAS, ATPase and Fis domain
MTDDSRTRTDRVRVSARSARRELVLAIVHHARDEHLGARIPLAGRGALVLGRSSTAFGRRALDEPLISRRHAEIALEAGRLSVRDLGSHNGTHVNGARIERAELRPGDVLGLGGVLFLLHETNPDLPVPVEHLHLVGASSVMQAVIARVMLVARRSAAVLVHGETGVGKELVARAVHEESGRRGALVAVNCSALADGILQSELFGHDRGAFSGAERARPGLVAAAQEGTLFLDEIGDASAALQASLLRLLEQREYRPVGSNTLQRADVRFVAATHVDLAGAVHAGRFREDLWARLSRWVIEVPPLRERREDVLLLARHFARALGGDPRPLSRELALALLRYDWPRNVRELEAAIEESVAESSDAAEIELAPSLAARLGASPLERPAAPSKPAARRRPTDAKLQALWREHEGNLTALAGRLGVARTTVYRWLRNARVDLGALRRADAGDGE